MRFSGKKLFLIGFIVLLLIGIPVTVYLVQQQQENRSHAEASTTLSFEFNAIPANNVTGAVGENLPLDIIVDPGTNLVSFIRLEIQYDPDKLSVIENGFQANSAKFPTVLSGPVYNPGTVLVSLSVGTDPTKAIQTKSRVGTLTFKPLVPTGESNPTLVTYSVKTIVTSVGGNDQASENVLANSTPATIVIAGDVPVTPTVPVPTDPAPTGVVPTDSVPVPTSTIPTPTTTGGTGAPICSALTADTLSGVAPLTVNFTANGTDEAGTITKATFNFGDGQVNDVTTGGGIGTNAVNIPLAHTYSTAGTFQATALLTNDSDGISDTANCTQTISVQGGSTVATATPTIQPSGSTEVMMGIGAAAVLMIIGGLLFFIL